MNQQQTKYLRERIAATVKQKIAKIESAIKIPKSEMTFSDMYKAIKSGTAMLKPLADLSDYTRLHHAYTYKEDSKLTADYAKAKKLKDSAISKVNKDAQNLVDELMLGDAEQALVKLWKFEQS